MGDVDYERHGAGYAVERRTDPRIAALIHEALGPGDTLVNVGAGAGSYEPTDRRVVAVEPSHAMRRQRPAHLAPVVAAIAERLPFREASFDAAMAVVTIHQWSDAALGLRELRRVSRGVVVVVTFVGAALDRFWLAEYVPESIAAERSRYPAIDAIRHVLGGSTAVRSIPIPIDCIDGFMEAYYARPERLLDPAVRRAQSAWTFVGAAAVEHGIARLRADLASGAWDERHGTWRRTPTFEGSLRLIVARPAAD
jgi:SAM-dependent methyltransferase